jgi:hypothetical protein
MKYKYTITVTFEADSDSEAERIKRRIAVAVRHLPWQTPWEPTRKFIRTVNRCLLSLRRAKLNGPNPLTFVNMTSGFALTNLRRLADELHITLD